MKRLLLLFLVMLQLTANGQLTVTDSLGTSALTALLEGFNVTISNLVVNCPPAAYGEFNGATSIPINNGLLLTSGYADGAAGPNNTSSWTGPATIMPGNPDLDSLVTPGTTNDACVIEFDCVPLGDTLLFNFAFGSEEYLEFVGSAFNDVFAIWLTGPGYPIPTNVATIPGGTAVSINNVNNLINSAYYLDNGDGSTAPFNVDPYYVQYDGFTQNLTAFAVVTPGASYHFKVAVADVGDWAYDSAVLLEAFSFRSLMGTSSLVADGTDNGMLVQIVGTVLEITLPDGGSSWQVRIIDGAGRTLRSTIATGDHVSISMDGLPSGVHILEVQDGARIMHHRFHRN